MKKRIAGALLGPLAAWVLVTTGLAQNAKIGFINTVEVLYGTEEGSELLLALAKTSSLGRYLPSSCLGVLFAR